MKKTGDAGPGQKSVGANVKMYAPAALLGHLRPAGRVRVRVGVGVGGRARDRPKLMNRDDGWRARRARTFGALEASGDILGPSARRGRRRRADPGLAGPKCPGAGAKRGDRALAESSRAQVSRRRCYKGGRALVESRLRAWGARAPRWRLAPWPNRARGPGGLAPRSTCLGGAARAPATAALVGLCTAQPGKKELAEPPPRPVASSPL